MSVRQRKRSVELDSLSSISSRHKRSNSGSTQRSTGDGSDSYAFDMDEEFTSIRLGDVFNLDPRPNFALRLDADFDAPFEPVFVNNALRSNLQLMKALPFKRRKPLTPQPIPKLPTADFRSWIKDLNPEANTDPGCAYAGVLWTGILPKKQWIIISGDHATSSQPEQIETQASRLASQRHQIYKENSPPRPRRALTSAEDANALLNIEPIPLLASFVTPGTPDWTTRQPEGQLSSHVIFARSIDWAATLLGDMSTWSREFRQVANLLMSNPHPCLGVAGNKHPRLMGTGFRGPFAELWDFVGLIFAKCRETGKSVAVTEQMLPIGRHGFLEETFYTWSITPLYGGEKEIQGLYNAPFETTKQTRATRAMKTLLRLGHGAALAKTVSTFWPKILSSLEENRFDFPFAVLYSVADDIDEESMSQCSESSQTFKSWLLEGTLGVPKGHHAVPKRLDLKRSRGGFVPSFRDALQTREPTLLSTKDGTLSEALIDGFEWRGFPEPCREALVCPIRPTTGENVLGFLVVGVNPRRPFDDDYQSFVQLLDIQLATSLASTTLLETEIRRGLTEAEAAALERARLSAELATQKNRMQRIAENSRVGMFSIDAAGLLLLEGNGSWFEMTGHSKDKTFAMSWMETIHKDSVAETMEGWKILTEDQVIWSTELRMKKPIIDDRTGEELENWVILDCLPEFDTEKKFMGVTGSITNISKIKWVDRLQARKLQEAEETRRAQNNFIDITSHEMRNPLSAILQCADGIATSLSEVMEDLKISDKVSDSLKESISSAETIQLCAQHQKSIVDDILTISKLDSNLLLIAPVPVQPVEIVRQALQTFRVECQKIHDIKLEFHIDSSFKTLGIDFVMLDSSRLLQVLINLMTNAIKFTKTAPYKTIDVSIGACIDPPTERLAGFEYFPTKKVRHDVTAASEWGIGEVIYLSFDVKDSGCGLNAEEKKKLFNRFSQASPRTHVQYSGNGTGLFISRQLTELQGGEIGVASEAGVGSTFAFYVKARRAESQQNLSAIQKRMNSEIQENARLATNSPQGALDKAASVSTLVQLTNMAESSTQQSSATNTGPEYWHIRKLGSYVDVANHGQEALDLIKETKHYKGREADDKELSVVLMDLEMPVMDGLICVRKIREMEAEGLIHGHLPIIAVTANARGEQIAHAVDSGMDDVMPKPFRILQIRAKIEALLSKIGTP
ncbi:related to sensory transduction histidine kinase [Phialocephala subalpina]|uniref:Related to sensory transduction histidine kinase n=1 Tax=Phialocephala subalpina TaxID=576137 RepID=A0A1L7XEN7_9HELO|nr:related to sensory transduction histidine kinase [Phialocephala subalpina]